MEIPDNTLNYINYENDPMTDILTNVVDYEEPVTEEQYQESLDKLFKMADFRIVVKYLLIQELCKIDGAINAWYGSKYNDLFSDSDNKKQDNNIAMLHWSKYVLQNMLNKIVKPLAWHEVYNTDKLPAMVINDILLDFNFINHYDRRKH